MARGDAGFQRLPPPNGAPPCRIDHSSVVGADVIRRIERCGKHVLHMAGDTGDVKNPTPPLIVSQQMETQLRTDKPEGSPSFFYELSDAVYLYGEAQEYFPQFAVLYRAGLRVSEAMGLYEKDIDFERCAIRVLFGKGGRSRTVGIDPGGLAHVRAWLDQRRLLGIDTAHPLFCIVQGPAWGDALDTGYVRMTFKRLAIKAGLAKRVHPHGLRHTHAAELREEGMDIGIISKQLGHRDISTTARYLDHVAPWAVVEAVRRRTS